MKTFTVEVEEDSKTGYLILPLPDELIEELDWKEGDTLKIEKLLNGFMRISKDVSVV